VEVGNWEGDRALKASIIGVSALFKICVLASSSIG